MSHAAKPDKYSFLNGRRREAVLHSVRIGEHEFAIPIFGAATLKTVTGDEVVRRILDRNKNLPPDAFTLDNIVCVLVQTMKAHMADSKQPVPLKWTISVGLNQVPAYQGDTSLYLENPPFSLNRIKTGVPGAKHSLYILDEEVVPVLTKLSPIMSTTTTYPDYTMTVRQDSLTIVVEGEVEEGIEAIGAAANTVAGSETQPVLTATQDVAPRPSLSKTVRPKRSSKEPEPWEAKLLEIFKIGTDSTQISPPARKRNSHEPHGRSKRPRIEAPGHDLANPKSSTATATALKNNTTPSPLPPTSKPEPTVVADKISAIDSVDVTTLRDSDPISYYSTPTDTAVDNTKRPQSPPASANIVQQQPIPETSGVLDSKDSSTEPSKFPSKIVEQDLLESEASSTPTNPTTTSTTNLPTTIPPAPPKLQPPTPTIITTTRQEIKAATREAMAEFKDEILTEMKEFLRSGIHTGQLGPNADSTPAQR